MIILLLDANKTANGIITGMFFLMNNSLRRYTLSDSYIIWAEFSSDGCHTGLEGLRRGDVPLCASRE